MSFYPYIKDSDHGGAPQRASRFAVSSARAKAVCVPSLNVNAVNVVVVGILAVIIIAVVVIIQT